MGTHARIENGYISIDTPAWLEQRTAGSLEDLTTDLRRWAARYDRSEPGLRDWPRITLAWCAARGHGSPDPRDPLSGPMVIAHIGTRLDREVWLARAVTPDGCCIVVVQFNEDAPVVYCDAVTDSGDWFDADTVEIGCPNGHGWIWRSGRELLDAATGSFTTLTVVFGPNLDAPFTRCPVCVAYALGQHNDPCGCDGTPWIVCPMCGERCDIHLPTH